MASFTITALETTAQTLLNNEAGYVATGAELVVTGGDAVTGSGTNRLVVLGNISTLSTGNNDAYVFAGTDLDVFVGAAGSIISVGSDGIVASASSRMEVLNAGTIMADATAVNLSASDAGATINVANMGAINGTTGLALNSGTSAVEIANSGSIVTNGTSISVVSPTGNTDLVNSGEIISASFAAISLGGGNDNIQNTGTIIGRVASGSGNDTITNTGTIIGEVDMGSGDDTFDGRGGVVSGLRLVEGGNGNDTYIIDDAGIKLVENFGAGIDTVQSLVNWTLGEYFENLTLLGADDLNGTGNGEANTITGNAGANQLSGEAGNDTILGGGGNDSIDGGNGDDILNGGKKADLLDGGIGEDTATYADASYGLIADLRTSATNTGEAFGDSYISIENLIGSQFNDSLRGDANANKLEGGEGNDVFFAREGNDTLNGGEGADALNGGIGVDTATYADAAFGLIADLLTSATNTGEAFGDSYISIENLIGSQFNDSLRGDANANRLEGGAGNDVFFARQGNDTLIGGAGDDTMSGQAGSDTFIFTNGFGLDVITDFAATNNAEKIDLSGVTAIVDFADLTNIAMPHMTQVGADVVIDDFAGNTITLLNVLIGNLDANDFVF